LRRRRAPLRRPLPTVKREELKDLQGRIQSLQKDIAKAEGSRADAAEELRETEQAISDANRLRELGGERTAVRATLGDLDAQSQKLSVAHPPSKPSWARLFTASITPARRMPCATALRGRPQPGWRAMPTT
jgi:septal ring factor EnvC (AmiA/AmiB activator)